ncbi:MAG TPA: HIT family protein [Usitatibacter sp.]|nr:HIT family protein [Usitatibacter sp.]
MSAPGCEFCASPGGPVLWDDEVCRVVRVDEPHYPGFCRVILRRHATEMADLAPAERDALMAVVWAVEAAVREAMRPDKMNIASLGNMTPHVHWHVIPRFRDDRHFPGPIWAAPQRDAPLSPEREARAARIPQLLRERLGAWKG